MSDTSQDIINLAHAIERSAQHINDALASMAVREKLYGRGWVQLGDAITSNNTLTLKPVTNNYQEIRHIFITLDVAQSAYVLTLGKVVIPFTITATSQGYIQITEPHFRIGSGDIMSLVCTSGTPAQMSLNVVCRDMMTLGTVA